MIKIIRLDTELIENYIVLNNLQKDIDFYIHCKSLISPYNNYTYVEYEFIDPIHEDIMKIKLL